MQRLKVYRLRLPVCWTTEKKRLGLSQMDSGFDAENDCHEDDEMTKNLYGRREPA
jgi:hypothetical protein